MTGAKKNKISEGGVDWGAVIIFFVLMIVGWANIYAAVWDSSGTEGFSFVSRYGSQLIWMGVCVIVAVVIMLIDEIYYHILAYPAYAVMILALIVTLFLGSEVNGARSWLKFGSFSIQPAEFGKVATALALARYMSGYSFSFKRRKDIFMASAIMALPMLIIMLQNDAGSAVVYMAFLLTFYREGFNGWVYVILGMFIIVFIISFLVTPAAVIGIILLLCALLAGAMNNDWKNIVRYLAGVVLFSGVLYVLFFVLRIQVGYWICLLISSVLSLAVVSVYAYRNKLRNLYYCLILFTGSLLFFGTIDYVFDNVLQVHQQKRILNLLGVESDLQNWGYNVHQSKIAIGSGGFWGKGFLQGTQTKYDFVPEQSTDFIFCTVGEEWGFVGTTAVLVLFCLLILRLMKMGERQNETFGRVYCYSVAAIFLFHVVVNVGMTVGMMPVIGIPLPLFSYGGSSLLAFTILFFIAVKLDSRRRESGGYKLSSKEK